MEKGKRERKEEEKKRKERQETSLPGKGVIN